MSRKKLRNRRFFRLHPGNLYEEGKRKTPVFKALHLLREPLLLKGVCHASSKSTDVLRPGVFPARGRPGSGDRRDLRRREFYRACPHGVRAPGVEEAVLRLRALHASHDFDEYWAFREAREYERNHQALYEDGHVPSTVKPHLKRRHPRLKSVK